MLFDAAAADRARFDRVFDVCVVGAGPAGITLARALAAKGLDVALMEGGGLDVSEESQDAYVGEIVGRPYAPLDVARLRVFGGSSMHWTGRCRALDAHNFEPLPHRPYGWPIGPADLAPYLAPASEILDLNTDHEGPDLALVQRGDRFRNVQFRHSPPAFREGEPTRFGAKYRDEVAAAARIACCLNANLVDLRLDPDLATVTGAVFRSYAAGDPGFTVRARAFCLCMGGLENPRMLLNFRSQKPNGIGNDQDLVGRYFCDHPTHRIAEVLFAHEQAITEYDLAPTLDFMLGEQVLDFVLWVIWRGDRRPIDRAKAFRMAAKCAAPFTERLARHVYGQAPTCHWRGLEEYSVLRDPDRYPTGYVWMQTEQFLNRDSRVGLAEATDAFGLRRIRFDWRLAGIDYHTMQTAMLTLGEHFAEQDIGRLKVRDWLFAANPVPPPPEGNTHMGGAYHHMCTTRMADDPREGVVDRNCRVHGTANLYVGGSSVFASPGFTTPTYTIVQLALRLGDHLAGSLTTAGRDRPAGSGHGTPAPG